ncbi:MAG: prepilin-type N-terminal cleavage/methylation domain-containing protein [Planctomycetota bacterium]|nr:prepilin-type N-terminal cleavage/methylation domain-containing protein [Planctomycetota bacterium]
MGEGMGRTGQRRRAPALPISRRVIPGIEGTHAVPVRFGPRAAPIPGTPRLARASGARGFTLIEVLAALLIMALGLTVIIGMFARAGSTGAAAAAENVVPILAPMAAAEIEMYHRQLWDKAYPNDKGRLDTSEFEGPAASLTPRFWPRRGTGLKLANTPYNQGGTTFCARYTLRKLFDPDRAAGMSEEQKANMIEQTAGMYVLTMVFYRVDPKRFDSNSRDDDDRLLKALSQVGDPVVLHLKDARDD